MQLLESFFVVCLCLAQVSLAIPLAFTGWPSTLRSGEPATVTWTGDLQTVRVAFPSDPIEILPSTQANKEAV